MKFDVISTFICRREGFAFEDINVRSKKRELAQTRHLIMYIARHFTTLSLEAIGSNFKHGNDHANVLASIKGIQNLYDTDNKWKLKIDFYMAHFKEVQERDYLFIPSLPDLVDLKEIRIRLGISLRKAAVGIPMAKTYIYHIENGIKGSQLPYNRVKLMLEYYRKVALQKDVPIISY